MDELSRMVRSEKKKKKKKKDFVCRFQRRDSRDKLSQIGMKFAKVTPIELMKISDINLRRGKPVLS